MHAAFFLSPFIIPLGAFAVAIVAIVAGIMSQAHANRLRSQDRMALLARGVPIPDIERLLKRQEEALQAPKNPLRSLGNARRAAVVLISVGIGLIVFFTSLAAILRVREILTGAAAGLIPLAIGLGFVVDYWMQRREFEKFSSELSEDL
ncbi:hypothetical protein FTO74_02120 [Granulicella sp. WH15]|uniref:DUF6249 domain-containing protein n=1 Tax=Granulicella sp. WH15 TaxID=2602070 RepID=UPI0013679B68|nr:DUF6249 domain-containing protein [Granulicella sp. WH15]QHN02301.1 hypothetical protein FTO74_02120 [Granulicella sp. WH15]